MGTNFYLVAETPLGEKEIHIGKRSAAGAYCWDCKTSLCKGGESRVHYSEGFFDKCPKCQKTPKKESFDDSTAGRELGFNKSKPAPKNGVASCSSFSWAITEEKFRGLVISPGVVIKDEYGRIVEDFDAVLSECPIRFHDMIDRELC